MKWNGATLVKALIAIVVVAAAAQTISFVNRDETDPSPAPTGAAPEVEVPAVTGLELETAEAALREAGLEPEVSLQPADGVALWSTVTAQIPAAGASASEGSLVALHAPEVERPELRLPNVTGRRCPASRTRHHEALRVALGDGHVLLGSATNSGVIRLTDAEGRVDTLWTTVGYRGPVLIRGGAVIGDGTMTFEQSSDWAPRGASLTGTPEELRFRGAPPGDLGWHALITFSEPGCYGFQMDGRDFTEHLIVEVKDAVAP